MSSVTTLLIARHGNTFNTDDVVRRVGITDLPLVESGLQQGIRLGQYLSHHKLIPDIIFTSELKRTIQTAEQAVSKLPHPVKMSSLSIFNELDYGIDENQPESVVIERIGKDVLTSWESEAIAPPGWNVDPALIIEHWRQFAKEIIDHYQGKTILVITSNGIARFAPYLTEDFFHFAKHYPLKLGTGCLGILQNTFPETHWKCIDWNIRPA